MLHFSQRNQLLTDKIVHANSDMMYAGVVVGNNTGEVWVDDNANPGFCMVWSEYLEGFHFMGSRCSHVNGLELKAFIESIIIPFLKSKGINSFEFSCDHKAWMPIICEMLSPREVNKSKQYVYKLAAKSRINTELALPAGYEVLEISGGFSSGVSVAIQNYEVIFSEIEKAWGSAAKFLERGKGFVAVQDNVICGFASTHFLYDNTYSFGTETYGPHKRKGLSSFLSMKLADEVTSKGANVRWDCMESNVASQKTAKKVGLVFSYEYEIGCFCFE